MNKNMDTLIPTRRTSNQIQIGGVKIGGGAPVIVQSMTNTDTRDIMSTIQQIKELEEFGCELIRVAVPDMEAAKALKKIKKGIKTDRVKLESTIHDSQLTATVNLDPTRGLKDEREMSSTLVTTEAGSAAAGSEGVSAEATGNPRLGQPNPVALPANPLPESLQYVTVYDNENKGGFAGPQPVGEAQNFP